MLVPWLRESAGVSAASAAMWPAVPFYLYNDPILLYGASSFVGQNDSTRKKTAGFSICVHLPGFHFGYVFLTRSHFEINQQIMWQRVFRPSGGSPSPSPALCFLAGFSSPS